VENKFARVFEEELFKLAAKGKADSDRSKKEKGGGFRFAKTLGALGIPLGAYLGGRSHVKRWREAKGFFESVPRPKNITPKQWKIEKAQATKFRPSVFARRSAMGAGISGLGGVGAGMAVDLLRSRLRKRKKI